MYIIDNLGFIPNLCVVLLVLSNVFIYIHYFESKANLLKLIFLSNFIQNFTQDNHSVGRQDR